MEITNIRNIIIDTIDVATRRISTLTDVQRHCKENQPTAICLCEQLDAVKATLEQIYALLTASAQHEEYHGFVRKLENAIRYTSELVRTIDKNVSQLECDISPNPKFSNFVKSVLESETVKEYLQRLAAHQKAFRYQIISLKTRQVEQRKHIMESAYAVDLFNLLQQGDSFLDMAIDAEPSLKPCIKSQSLSSNIAIRRMDFHILRNELRTRMLGRKSEEPINSFVTPQGHKSERITYYGSFSKAEGSKKRSKDIDQFLSTMSRYMCPSQNLDLCIPVLGADAGLFVNTVCRISHDYVALDKRTKYRRAVRNYIMLRLLVIMELLSSQDGAQADPDFDRSFAALLEATEYSDAAEDCVHDLTFEVKDALLYCASNPVMQALFDNQMIKYCTDMTRILDQDYIPIEDDVVLLPPLHDPFRITHREMSVKTGEVTFRLIEPRSRSSGLVKWISMLDRTARIFFAVDLCGYDERITMDTTKTTRLLQSLELWDEIVNADWVWYQGFNLFFMNYSKFKNKLDKVPFKLYFPEYAGENEQEAVYDYLVQRFEALNRKKRDVYTHPCRFETDEDVRMILSAVKDSICYPGCRFGLSL